MLEQEIEALIQRCTQSLKDDILELKAKHVLLTQEVHQLRTRLDQIQIAPVQPSVSTDQSPHDSVLQTGITLGHDSQETIQPFSSQSFETLELPQPSHRVSSPPNVVSRPTRLLNEIVDLTKGPKRPINQVKYPKHVQQSPALNSKRLTLREMFGIGSPPVKKVKVTELIRAKPIASKKPTGDEKNLNYREAVRDQSKRENMQAFQCPHCAAFYAATGQIPHLCSKAGKHRYHRPPTNTPAGFWDPWSFSSDERE